MMDSDPLIHCTDLLRRYVAPGMTWRADEQELENLISFQRVVNKSDVQRLAVFRLIHGVCIRSVSPLLVRMCEIEKLSLDSLVEQMRPGAPWERWLAGRSPRQLGTGLATLAGALPLSRKEIWRLRRMLLPGLMIRPRRHADGALGIVPTGASLDMAVRLSSEAGGFIRTRGGRALLLLDQALPEIVQAALPGRQFDDLLVHPLTNGCGYNVERITSVGRAVVLATGTLGWRCPWVRNSECKPKPLYRLPNTDAPTFPG